MSPPGGNKVDVAAEADLVLARRQIREFAVEQGFTLADVTRIVTAASELARNLLTHGGGGRVCWGPVTDGGRRGIEMVFADHGPGIVDIEQAMEPGFTTGRGLGMGLSGSQRLMDDFELDTAPGKGTTVTTRKWLP